jgi:hypothetical protein
LYLNRGLFESRVPGFCPLEKLTSLLKVIYAKRLLLCIPHAGHELVTFLPQASLVSQA